MKLHLRFTIKTTRIILVQRLNIRHLLLNGETKNSPEERKKARLTYKCYELLTYESDKSASLYEIAGFIKLKYRFWRQGRYVPSQQELDAIAAFYGIDPLYFDTSMLPYISKSAEYNEFKVNRIKLYPND